MLLGPGGFPNIGALSLGGTTLDGERMITVAAQRPEREPGIGEQISKDALEALHLARYMGDAALVHGHLPFEWIKAGANPPDFRVGDDVEQFGLDCTVIAFESWRSCYRIFERFFTRLNEEAQGRDLSGLAGCSVGVYFGKMNDLPPKLNDDRVVGALLDLMEGQSIDFDAVARMNQEIVLSGPPREVPEGVMAAGRLDDESAGFFANPVSDPRYGSVPLDRPLEVSLAMTETVTISAATGSIQRLVTKHDKPEIQRLLITAGGPDRDGLRYPAEEMLGQFVLEESPTLTAIHIEQVDIHLWGQGRVSTFQLAKPEAPI